MACSVDRISSVLDLADCIPTISLPVHLSRDAVLSWGLERASSVSTERAMQLHRERELRAKGTRRAKVLWLSFPRDSQPAMCPALLEPLRTPPGPENVPAVLGAGDLRHCPP